MKTAGVFKYIELAAVNNASDCVRHKYNRNFTEFNGQLILATVKTCTVLELKAMAGTANLSWKLMQHPKIAALGLTVLAAASVSIAFYATLPCGCGFILLHRVKYIAFMQAEAAVLGIGLRTLGRLSNPQLMELFYQNCGDLPPGKEWPEPEEIS